MAETKEEIGYDNLDYQRIHLHALMHWNSRCIGRSIFLSDVEQEKHRLHQECCGNLLKTEYDFKEEYECRACNLGVFSRNCQCTSGVDNVTISCAYFQEEILAAYQRVLRELKWLKPVEFFYPRHYVEKFRCVLKEFNEKHKYEFVFCRDCGIEYKNYSTAFLFRRCERCTEDAEWLREEKYSWKRLKTPCERCGKEIMNGNMAKHQETASCLRKYGTQTREEQKSRFLQTQITRGKYTGKTVAEVLEINPGYMDWCAGKAKHNYFKNLVEKWKYFFLKTNTF